MYDRLGDSWWDEASPLNALHGSLTPARLGYFRGVMNRQLPEGAVGLRALDIGCGGGFLAEELARLGCRVVGVDPSVVSIDAARRHAAQVGADIEYRVGTGEDLPVDDGAFDIACCCDVLEHVGDLDRVAAETARALRSGGLYLFDTINRTRTSKLLAIKVLQEWPATRIVDDAFHDWAAFVRPGELTATLARNGLQVRETVGLGPRANVVALLRAFVEARLGRIGYGELSRRARFGQIRSTAVSYMGFATKPAQ